MVLRGVLTFIGIVMALALITALVGWLDAYQLGLILVLALVLTVAVRL